MNNFEAKADRSEINNTFYLVPNRMNPPGRYGQALGLEPSGKCLTVEIQERISFLREEMNFQIKSCHSRLEHFWNSSWHFFTCLSIHLFIRPVFRECLAWTLALWVPVMMRWDCQLSWGRECFLTSCWILVPGTTHGKLKIRLVGWSDLYEKTYGLGPFTSGSGCGTWGHSHQKLVWWYSVVQLCPTFCDAVDCSMPGFPVFHYLPGSLLKFKSIESVMPSNCLILCRPHLFLPSIFPSIKVFSNELALELQHQSFQWIFRLISFRMVGLTSLPSKGFSRVFSNTTIQKHPFFSTQPSLWSNSHILPWLLEKP